MIADSSKIKSKYKLGIIDVVNTSKDNQVRSAVVRYYNKKGLSGDLSPEKVTRSVQRLTLILPVEEQDSPLRVNEAEEVVQVTACT